MKTNMELLTRIRIAYTLGMGLLIMAVVGAYFLVDARIRNREKDADLVYSVAWLVLTSPKKWNVRTSVHESTIMFLESRKTQNKYPRKGIPMFLIRLASRFLLPFLLLASTVTVAAEKEVYILAVVPQFTPSEVHRTWTPIVEKLSKATGRQFQIKLYPSFPKFEEAFLDGEIDLAFMNPYHAVMAKRAQGYIPLLRDDANPLTGILVVQRDSPIKSIKELNGKTLAFPAPNAFGASLYMRALLAEQEKISITPHYLKTHSNVYRHVIMGEAAAGGGVNNTLKREPPEVQAQLRVLFETPGVPSHPLVAHPRVPERVRQAVTNTLLELGNDPAGQKLLTEIQLPKPVKADYARDYQALEKLKLEKHVVIEKD